MKQVFLSRVVWPVCAAMFVLGGAHAAQAEKITYQCNIKGAQDRDWIQPLIFVGHDVSGGRVVVSDAAILGFNDGQPVEGRLVKNNKQRVTFAWNLEMRSGSNQRVTMKYRATYVKSTGKVSIVAQPKGYGNIFTRGGSCDVKKLAS